MSDTLVIVPTYNEKENAEPIAQAVLPANPARIVYSAAHVVADPFTANDPSGRATVDWGKTMEFRRYLAGLGLGIAEAMDTAQRGMGLDWPTSLELIRRLPTFAGQKPQDIDAAVNALIDEGVVEFIAKGDGHFIWPALEGAMETALEAANAPALVDLQGKPLY